MDSTTPPTVQESASSLHSYLFGSGHPPFWLQGIGHAPDHIHVYLVRRDWEARKALGDIEDMGWEGWPVRVTVIGRVGW